MADLSTTIDGWTIDGSTAMKAWRSPIFREVDLEVDGDSLYVTAEMGSGYEQERTNAQIPIGVLLVLLRHAGYEVSPLRVGTGNP